MRVGSDSLLYIRRCVRSAEGSLRNKGEEARVRLCLGRSSRQRRSCANRYPRGELMRQLFTPNPFSASAHLSCMREASHAPAGA